MTAQRVLDHAESGFSLVELLTAMALSLVIVAGMMGLVNPAQRLAVKQPDAIEMHQRLRVAASKLMRDLRMAGAGLDSGPAVGPLNGYLPAILPRRLGALGTQLSTVARADIVTLIWVPLTASQTTTAALFSGTSLDVAHASGCPSDAACGLAVGANAVVFDASGHFDLFNVSGLAGSAVSIRGLGPVSGHAYAPGAFVAETQIRTYYLDAPAHQLRQYDGDATDTPVIDDVSGFSVEYFGTPDPPHAPMPILGTANCLYDTGGRLQPGLQVLASRTDGLATLPLGLLSDGPWCGTGGTQFDADLLRVRRVRVTLGVRDSSSTQRLADLVASFDVAPRNLRAVD